MTFFYLIGRTFLVPILWDKFLFFAAQGAITPKNSNMVISDSGGGVVAGARPKSRLILPKFAEIQPKI